MSVVWWESVTLHSLPVVHVLLGPKAGCDGPCTSSIASASIRAPCLTLPCLPLAGRAEEIASNAAIEQNKTLIIVEGTEEESAQGVLQEFRQAKVNALSHDQNNVYTRDCGIKNWWPLTRDACFLMGK